MEIVCNGEKKDIQPGTTVESFLHGLGIKPDTVFVECDSVIIKRSEYETFVLREGARLELIRFVGGG
ncbi:MAG: thiamine biosynthesis protein ThiS [Desulfobulbaceae bacterium DB1]|nr:MAG: thiamine biosynthesis protein ThiS [Desulfobulbaceae bacterium DB1]